MFSVPVPICVCMSRKAAAGCALSEVLMMKTATMVLMVQTAAIEAAVE